MNKNKKKQPCFARMLHRHAFLVFFLCISMVFTHKIQALNLTVEGINQDDGTPNTVITEYRWLIEEDKTYHVRFDGSNNPDPTAIEPNWSQGNTLPVSFHRSHMPMVATGDNSNINNTAGVLLDSTKHYLISVLPNVQSDGSHYSLGSAQIAPGQTDVTVYVNKKTIPTAHITVFAHEETAPINNAWDQGERGLKGFSVVLEDGFRYPGEKSILEKAVTVDDGGAILGDPEEVSGTNREVTK